MGGFAVGEATTSQKTGAGLIKPGTPINAY
jgi:hypothetical protein